LVFDLALLEESDGLLVKLLLGTGVVAALEAFVLVVVGAVLRHVMIAANLRSLLSKERLHLAGGP
jgi:hypothetical protein